MNYLNWLTLSSTLLLTAAPSFAASPQITEIDLTAKKQKLELKLELDANQKNNVVPSLVTIDRGQTLEATILNTELNLAKTKSFNQQNPTSGISTIKLDSLDEEHTTITLVKDQNLDLKPSIIQKDSEIILSFEPVTKTNSQLSKSSLVKNIIDLKNNVASLITNQKTKDNEKETPKVIQNQNQDILVPNPEIIISEGDETQIVQPTNNYEDTYLPRAVAPPVGDMAVSNISTFPDTVDLGSSAVVPRLVLRDAPVREVLSLLARQAGLNIVFAIESGGDGGNQEGAVEGPTVSVDLENQSVQEAFDSILLISNLSASRRGNIIYIGNKLPAQARNLISRTIRLNQVRAENAALFLASQGAQGQRLTTEVEETVDPETGRVVQRKELPASLESLGGSVEDEEEGSNSTNALLLRGLQVATDDRLNSITLVGEPRKVEMATTFLTQLDARRRQVAVNIKVIDVNLLNQDVFNSSFSFGINDTFYTQDNGSAILNFGDTRPPSGAQINASQFSPAITPLNLSGAEESLPFFDRQPDVPFGTILPGVNDFTDTTSPYARPGFGTLDNPFAPGVSNVSVNPVTGQVEYEYSLPSLFQFPKRFLAQLEARITSGNAKILTDPTVVVQEGQESTVKLTQDIIKGIDSTINENGVTTNTPIYDEAGLTVTVNVERIDDNGFVSLSISPTVSSIASTQEFDSGNAVNLISLLSRREVSSGLIRLRDGQTLILSGIIQDQERVAVTKVPILGDIPLLGSLFRSTNKTNERAEVIVLLTPEIIDEQANFGYNYQPSKETNEILRKGGMDLPNNPEQ